LDRNKYFISLRQIIFLLLFVLLAAGSFGQKEIYRGEHDDIPYYFGATFGYNVSSLRAIKSAKFYQDDSVLVALPGSSGGISIGLLATGRLSEHFQIRFNPQIIIGSSRYFDYIIKHPLPGEPIYQKKTLPTMIVSFPLHFKFNSDRIDNFRVYLLGGIKYDLYFGSNASESNTGTDIKFKSTDFGIEGGIGFNFFLHYFTLSPEIKFSNGLSNILQRDPSVKYSSVFDKLQTRMIMFSLHFEY
jgi:hypothetical protein